MVKKSRSLVVLFLSISLGIILNIAPGQNVSVVNPQVTIPEPDALWAVQCGVFSLQDSAASMVEKITGLGYSPVWIEETNGLIKVIVGKCEVYVEAMALPEPGAFGG